MKKRSVGCTEGNRFIECKTHLEKSMVKTTKGMSKRKFHSHLLWIVQPLLSNCSSHRFLFPPIRTHSMALGCITGQYWWRTFLGMAFDFLFIYLLVHVQTLTLSRSICCVYLACDPRTLSTFIIVVFFVAAKYDFFSLLRLHLHCSCHFCLSLFTLSIYLLCLAHASTRHIFHLVISMYKIKKKSMAIFFPQYEFIFCHHFSFVQSSILYYIEFSAIAFVLFNLSYEQSRSSNEKWICSKLCVYFFVLNFFVHFFIRQKKAKKSLWYECRWCWQWRFTHKNGWFEKKTYIEQNSRYFIENDDVRERERNHPEPRWNCFGIVRWMNCIFSRNWRNVEEHKKGLMKLFSLIGLEC